MASKRSRRSGSSGRRRQEEELPIAEDAGVESDSDAEEVLEALDDSAEILEAVEDSGEMPVVGDQPDPKSGAADGSGHLASTLGFAFALAFPYLFVTALAGSRYQFLSGVGAQLLYVVLVWLLVASAIWHIRSRGGSPKAFLPFALAGFSVLLLAAPWTKVSFDLHEFRRILFEDRIDQLNSRSRGGKASKAEREQEERAIERTLVAVMGGELYESEVKEVLAFRQTGLQAMAGMASYDPVFYQLHPDNPRLAGGMAGRMASMQPTKGNRWFRPEELVQPDGILIATAAGIVMLMLFTLGAARSVNPGGLQRGALGIGAITVILFLIFVVLGWRVEKDLEEQAVRLRNQQPRKELYSQFHAGNTMAPFVSCLYGFFSVLLLGVEIYRPREVVQRSPRRQRVDDTQLLEEPPAAPARRADKGTRSAAGPGTGPTAPRRKAGRRTGRRRRPR